MPVEFDREYSERILSAMTQAVIKTSMDEDRVCMLKSHEIADAALDIIAMFSATSSETKSPTKRRELVDRLGKRLLGKIVAFQAELDAHGGQMPGGPWMTLNDDDTAH